MFGVPGLDEDVIREAREFVTGEGVETESLISELKQKSRELDIKLEESGILRQEAAHLRLSVKNELLGIDAKKQEALAKALREATKPE